MLYEEPATAFVANFLGASNLIPAQVADGGADASASSRCAPTSNGRTGEALAMIRPERVRLEPHGSAGENRVPGMVEAVVYMGFHQDVRVRLASGALVRCDVPNDGTAVEHASGDPVVRAPAGRLPAGAGAMRRREELVAAARRVIGRDGFAARDGRRDHARGGRLAGAARTTTSAPRTRSSPRRSRPPRARTSPRWRRSRAASRTRPTGSPPTSTSPSGRTRRAWRLWVDAWGESVHSPLVRDTLGRFDVGWRAVLAEVLADGVRQGCWECADPQDTAARLVAVLDGIGLHTTRPRRGRAAGARGRVGAAAGRARAGRDAARRRRRWSLAPAAARVHETRIEIRARDLDAHGHVDPAVLFTFLEEARAAWLGDRVPDAVVTHVAVGYLRPLGREPVTVTCTLDAVGRASFRTRETVATDGRRRRSRPRRRSRSRAAR